MTFNNYLEDENDKPYFTTNSLAYYYDKMEGFAEKVEGSAKALNLTKEEVEKRLTLYIEQNKNELDQRLAQWDGKLETFDSSVETLLSEWVDDGTLTHIIDTTLIEQKIAPLAGQVANIENYYIDLRKPHKGLSGVTGVGDETSKLQNIISSIPAGATAELFLNDLQISLLSNLSLPKGFNLTGRNATILLEGELTLVSDNVLKGFTINGNWKSKGVILKGNNCHVHSNNVINFKTFSETVATYAILAHSSSRNFLVEKNNFKGFQPFSEDGIGGNTLGSSRAVLIHGDGKVRNNYFDGMVGYEDSDYIVVESSELIETEFPFNLLSARDYRNVSIYDNDFIQTCKSSIKIMGSGVTCYENRIKITGGTSSNVVYAGIRTHRTKDVEIYDNKITSDFVGLVTGIHADYTRNAAIERNKLIFLNDIPLGAAQNVMLSLFNNAIKIKGNTTLAKGGNYRSFRIEDSKNGEVKDNTTIINTSRTMETSFIWTQRNEKVEFKKNKLINPNTSIIYSDSDSGNQFIDNALNNVYFNLLNGTDFIVDENDLALTNTTTPNLFILTGITGFKAKKNKIVGGYTTYLRIATPSTKIKWHTNDVDNPSFSTLYNLYNNPDQLLSEIEYIKSVSPLVGYEYGTTTQRPAIQKTVTHKYFDTSLNKELIWNGSVWKDGTGTTV